ncbi:hypothetical protein THRCLA_07108 [Thraustotheca clavata]|uniref:CHK kinase-like domain-containing protein n=1 Tax=Thraustotheca clavata TaxID=74557 RepID=A0A1V9ZGD2_9STRA|nr:hypothetical protein THRCLA_07108 [Thraustotheca clavata]
MTTEVQTLVRSIFANKDIKSVKHESMDVGVLSNVIQINVVFNDQDEQILIAKFPRPEFPIMHTMFAVEAAFYLQTDHSRIPFMLPNLSSASSNAIVLEKVENVTMYKCIDGCPPERIPTIIQKLALLHALHWGKAYPELAAIPGIGANLSAANKQAHFANLFQPFLVDLTLSTQVKNEIINMCQYLSQGQRPTLIHEAVEKYHKTLIHGDFHVANMLFGKNDQIYLVDWATCGASNPLRDLAFFFTISVSAEVRHQVEANILRSYATTLVSHLPSLSIESIETMYYLCQLNQFLILVGYNQLTMSLATLGSSPAKQEALRNGFLKTNERSCLAALNAYHQLKTNVLANMK